MLGYREFHFCKAGVCVLIYTCQMVANAGIAGRGELVTCKYIVGSAVYMRFRYVGLVPVENFDRVIAVNLRGPMLCYKYAGLQMIKQGCGGRIIGMFSQRSTVPCQS